MWTAALFINHTLIIFVFSGKNKSYLLDQGVIGVVKSIFENHFQRRALDPVHSEISLIAVAVIRHLSKTSEFVVV
jgi:hypothetical protein